MIRDESREVFKFMMVRKRRKLANQCAGKHIAIEDIGHGIWKVFFRNVFLGFFAEKHLRNKQQSTRL